jgi:streptogramin lyase
VRAVLGASIPIPSGAVDVAVEGGTVWVSGVGMLTRLDAGTGRVVDTVRTPGTEDYSQVAVGLGAVWVTADGGWLYRVDPATDRVAVAIAIGGPIQGVDTGAGSVWVTRIAGEHGDLIRVDPTTNRVSSVIKVGPGPAAVLYAFGALWVMNTSPPSVDRVDPSTGRVTTTRFSGLIAAGYGSLWAALDSDVGSVVRVDPQTGEPIAVLRVPRAEAVAVGAGGVWVLAGPRSSSPTLFYPIKHTAGLWQIDPSTNRVVGPPVLFDALQPIPISAAAGDGAVWVADYDSRTVTRFDVEPCQGSACTP